MDVSELRQKISENRSDKYQKFRYAFQIIKLASKEAFEEAYGSTSNFLFEINSQGQPFSPMTDERGMYNSTSFNQTVKQLTRSKTIKYKFHIDNGKAPDLTYRSTRGDIIKKIIDKLKKYNDLLRLLNIKHNEIEFTARQGGENPTLKFSINYSKRIPDKKTGKPKVVKMPLIFQVSLKARNEKQTADKNPLKTLKPSDLKPAIVGVKLTPEIFKTRIQIFIKKHLQASQYVKNLFSETVELADNDSLFVKSNMSSEISSELFEVLSALKLAKLIKGRNKNFLKDVLSFNDEMIKSIDPAKVKIKIPRKANEPLMDYEVFYTDNLSIKVSVKSRVTGEPATVKFSTVFGNEAEVDKWFNDMKYKSKSILGSKLVASTALEYNARGGGKETLYPVKALYKLLNDSQFSSRTWSDTKSQLKIPEAMTKDIFKSILSKVDKNLSRASARHVPLDAAFDLTLEELKYAKLLIAYNIAREANVMKKYTEYAEKNMVSKEVYTYNKKSKTIKSTMYLVSEENDLKEKRYPFALNNFGYLCEKVVVRASKKGGASKINFWKLFYDNVLVKKQILYSVMYEKSNSGNAELEYAFKSTANFKKYQGWVELRSKNSAFNLQDTLGMNP
jgi:hypothetical protein